MYLKNSSKLIGKNEGLEITFNCKSIFKTIIAIVVAMTTLSSVGQIYQYVFNQGNDNALIRLFWLDSEQSIPTVYATFSLFLCSILLAIIAQIKYLNRDRYRLHWRMLSFIFLYLGIDEGAAIHEISMRVMRNLFNAGGFLYFAWIIPAMILLSLFCLIYFKFILALPQNIRFLFVASGVIFLCGALGVEAIGAKVFVIENYDFNNPIYAILATIEETLEMIGIAIFIFALLNYIKSYISYLKISI